MSSLVLYANDIRIKDHQALTNALKHNANTHACFIFFEPSFKKYGGRRNQFFMDSLQLLEKNLAHLGIPFHILEARNTKEAEQAFQKELPKQPKDSSLRGTCGPFYLTLSGRVLFLRINYLNVKGTFSTAGRSLGGRTLKQAFEELWKILKLETGVVPKGKKVIAYNLMQSVHKRIELERSRGVPVPDVKLGYGDNYSCVLTVDGHPSLVKKPQVRKGK